MDFSLETLTAAINEIPHMPSQLGDSGLFNYAGVATLTVDIEKKGHTLALVSTKVRGAPGEPIGRDSRNIRTFRIPHLPLNDQIAADEVQDVRAFGTTEQPEPFEQRVQDVMTIGVQRFDLTMEYHRLGALRGLVLDKDGSTLFDFFDEFGLSPVSINFALASDSTDVRSKCSAVLRAIRSALGGQPFRGAVAYCGADYWDKLQAHPSVRDTYLGQAQAAELRGDPRVALTFGGIRWEEYVGEFNGAPAIAANKALIVPAGVPNLLLGRYAPANYTDTVNTRGLPLYAMGVPKPNKTGWDIEMQSNPIHINTNPTAVIEATI